MGLGDCLELSFANLLSVRRRDVDPGWMGMTKGVIPACPLVGAVGLGLLRQGPQADAPLSIGPLEVSC